MILRYLLFDYSEDELGHGGFDAMASAAAAQRPALEAELAAVLRWAHRSFPEGPRALEEGGEWDFAVQGVLETPQPLSVSFDAGTGALALRAEAPGAPRTTVDFTLTGSPGFCAAFRRAFHLDPPEPP